MAQRKGIPASEVEQVFFRTIRPSSLLQRFATVDEVATLVTFIASPLSSVTNRAAVRAEGGVIRSILWWTLGLPGLLLLQLEIQRGWFP